MAEMETLRVLDAETVAGLHLHGVDAAEIDRRALSWLASVLADDATVEVVQAALHSDICAPDGEVCCWNEETSTCAENRLDGVAQHLAAALSAHLAAPGPAGDASGEDGL